MRFYALICLTMVAFAANSLLNRVAIDNGHSDPASFAVIRVAAGAVTLIILAYMKKAAFTWLIPSRALGGAALAIYMIGFSSAYLTLPAGIGALILFGVVQISIFIGAGLMGETPTRQQVIGALIAFLGLVIVLKPSATFAVDTAGAAYMALAGLGWAIYTLTGRYETNPLAGSGANFVLALPLTLLAPVMSSDSVALDGQGVMLAVLSGSIASGMGYALWYALLPRLNPSTAGILMLSVPVLAVMGGVLFLQEDLHPRFLLGTVLVLGGLSLSILQGRFRMPGK